MSRSYPTTAAHFACFEREVRRALRDLGVNDLTVYVQHAVVKGAHANVTSSVVGRTATVRLARSWTLPPTAVELREAAREEATHVALAPIVNLGCARFVTRDEVDAACESVTKRMAGCVRWSGGK